MRTLIVICAISVAYTKLPVSSHDLQAVSTTMKSDGALSARSLPKALSQSAKICKLAFEAKCAPGCRTNAAGQDGVAPPLALIIYEQSTNGAEASQCASAMAVRAHHGPFGNMFAVAGVTHGDIKTIKAYV